MDFLEKVKKKMNSIFSILDCQIPKIVRIGKENIDVSDMVEIEVKGDGLKQWGIDDGHTVYVKPFVHDECLNIESKPIVLVREYDDALFSEVQFDLWKFIGYFDIRPQVVEKELHLYEKALKANDSSVFVADNFPLDVFRWSKFYGIHKLDMPELNPMAWQSMCMKMDNEIFIDRKYKRINYHKLCIICKKYSNSPTEYKMVSVDCLGGIAKYIN